MFANRVIGELSAPRHNDWHNKRDDSRSRSNRNNSRSRSRNNKDC